MASARIWQRIEPGHWEYRPNGSPEGMIMLMDGVYKWAAAHKHGTEPHYSEAQDAVRKALREQQPTNTPMDADTYQKLAARTLIDKPEHEIPGHDMMLVWVALGLTGEAGEVAEHIKKGVLHQHGVDHDQLVKELGDVAWYLAGLATLIGVPLSEVFDRNIQKLVKRYPDGWGSEASKARIDTL